MSANRLLVILPTYNERENIEPIIEAIFVAAKQMPNIKTEILVVDDKSPDGTATVVRKLQKKHKDLHLNSGSKQGLGEAYKRGFRWGFEQNKYQTFIMMDADFSHDPFAIPSLIKALDEGNDFVIGSRYVLGGAVPGNWPLRRIFNSRVANWLVRQLVGMRKVEDVTSGFRAIRVSAFKDNIDLNNLNATGYFFLVNLLYEFWSSKLSIAEVPITFVDRRAGVSKIRIFDVLEFIYSAYQINPKSRVRRAVRFVTVGACGTIVNLLVLHLLVRYAGLRPEIAVIIAIEASIISNFLMNHHYTFRHEREGKDPLPALVVKFLKYNVGTLGGALISYVVFILLLKAVGLEYLLADIIAIAAATVWNYWVSTKFIWKIIDRQ